MSTKASLAELIKLREHVKFRSLKLKNHACNNSAHLTNVRGRGMEFAEVRNYQPGDDIRHIQWRITAKTGKTHVKLYQEEKERPLVLFIDFSKSMYFGTRTAYKSVIAAHLASILTWSALKNHDKVGGIFANSELHAEFVPKSQQNFILPMLRSLSNFTQEAPKLSKNYLNLALQRLKHIIRPGSSIVLISDFYQLPDFNMLHNLRKNNNILAYHISDPLELAAPKPGRYPIFYEDKPQILDTNSFRVRKKYNEFCQKRSSNIKNFFLRLQANYVAVKSTDNLARIIYETYG